MSFFSGRYNYSLDTKGRINFKKFLKRISEKDIISGNFHLLKQQITQTSTGKKYSFFYIFTENSWSEFIEDKGVNNWGTEKRLLFLNRLCGEASLDSADRLCFNKDFVSYIAAGKQLVLQGDGNKIQVWNEEDYIQYVEEQKNIDDNLLDIFG